MKRAKRKWLGTAELGLRLGLSPWHAYRLALSGKLESRRINGHWQVTLASVRKYERTRTAPAPAV